MTEKTMDPPNPEDRDHCRFCYGSDKPCEHCGAREAVRSSSIVEQSPVKTEAVGASPTSAAITEAKGIKGAFDGSAGDLLDDAFAAIAAKIEGRPYTKKFKPSLTIWYEFRVLEDHTFEDHSQEFNNGILSEPCPIVFFKKDQLVSLREKESKFFMPDRSKLEFIREYEE